MKFPEHITSSYLLAQLGVQQQYGAGGTVFMILAGNLPDIDTLTLVAGWRVYRTYHRIVGHGLPVSLAGPALLAWLSAEILGLGPFWPLWGWLQTALLLHLLSDVCFYRWPVQLLWPLSTGGWGLGLVSWNDLIPTLVLYAASVVSLIWQAAAPASAGIGLGLFALYLGWRALAPRPQEGWAGWLTGGWAPNSPRFWRMLTGDFIT